MSADLLRRAAALMRDRAEAATPGPWRHDEMQATRRDGHYFAVNDGSTELLIDRGFDAGPNGAHAASWHPAVALAVADWLECQADTTCDCGLDEGALAAARAYLGEAS